MFFSKTSKLSLLLILLCSFNSYSGDLRDFVESSSRSESNALRDVYRNPVETLSFFGLKSDMTVIELSPGGGWYTEILAPYLKESGGGSIINFGSISGQRAEAKAAAYSATKGAVHAWTRSAAGAWGQDNIRVNAILPAMHTPMSRTAGKHLNEEQLNERYWRNYHGIALGRDYGDPDEDLGPVMVFMASDASHFITGQLLPVDGGQTNVR